MGDSGVVTGVVIGVGVLIGGFLLLRPKTAHASTLHEQLRRAHQGSFTPHGAFPPLVERWRGEVAKRAGDLPVDGILKWIEIESGGDMSAKGIPVEAGIFQLYFPDDKRFGATLEGLKAIAAKSDLHKGDISWLSPAEMDMEVGSGIRKVQAARDFVRGLLIANNVHWPENSFDFGSAVKQVHALPAVLGDLLPKVAAKNGPPASWAAFRQAVMAMPSSQMSPALQRFAGSPSNHGLANRIEDTMANAEDVGRAWGPALA